MWHDPGGSGTRWRIPLDDLLQGLPPIEAPGARVLVLGTFPGPASLAAGRYYAHPRNTFWRLLGPLAGFEPEAPYEVRVAGLARAGIALWDVLAACRRQGSGDAAIRDAVPNDFPGFLARHPRLERIAFNGQPAARLFDRRVRPVLDGPGLPVVVLPSSSPAAARLTLAEKAEAWRLGLSGLVLLLACLALPVRAAEGPSPSPPSSPLPAVVPAPDARGSVRLGPVAIEGAAPGTAVPALSVRVAIGIRTLWQSDARPGPAPRWPVSLRAYTARSQPLVFSLVEGAAFAPAAVDAAPRPAPLPRPRRGRTVREQDATLSDALPGFVADWGTGTLDDPGLPGSAADASLPPRRPAAARSRVAPSPDAAPAPGRVRCRTRLPWPPADGEHRLPCGNFTVVVETRWLGEGR